MTTRDSAKQEVTLVFGSVLLFRFTLFSPLSATEPGLLVMLLAASTLARALFSAARFGMQDVITDPLGGRVSAPSLGGCGFHSQLGHASDGSH